MQQRYAQNQQFVQKNYPDLMKIIMSANIGHRVIILEVYEKSIGFNVSFITIALEDPRSSGSSYLRVLQPAEGFQEDQAVLNDISVLNQWMKERREKHSKDIDDEYNQKTANVNNIIDECVLQEWRDAAKANIDEISVFFDIELKEKLATMHVNEKIAQKSDIENKIIAQAIISESSNQDIFDSNPSDLVNNVFNQNGYQDFNNEGFHRQAQGQQVAHIGQVGFIGQVIFRGLVGIFMAEAIVVLSEWYSAPQDGLVGAICRAADEQYQYLVNIYNQLHITDSWRNYTNDSELNYTEDFNDFSNEYDLVSNISLEM